MRRGETARTPLAASIALQLRFLTLFIAGFFVLQTAYYAIPEPVLNTHVNHWATVQPAAFLLNLLTPSEQVVAVENSIVSSHARLEVIRGCDGSGGVFLMLAAVLAVGTGWRQRLIGLLGALGLMFALNQLRILVLYYVVAYRGQWFTAVHGYIAPTLIVVVAGFCFLVWLTWALPKRDEQGVPS